MELQRKGLSLHPTIFEKGSLTPCSKSFPTYQPNYLWFLFSKVERKGVFFQKTGFWRTLLSNFMNCFSLHLWKKVVDTMFQRFSNLSTKLFMGLQRTPLSLHPTIFEKGSLTLCSKMFSNLSTKLFMVFIFESREKGVFFQKTGFWRTLLSIFMNCFSLHFWKRVVDTIHQNVFQLINQIYLWVFIFRLAEKGYNTMQLYIYSLIRTRNPDLRSSSFVSHRFCPTYMEGLGIQKWVGHWGATL